MDRKKVTSGLPLRVALGWEFAVSRHIETKKKGVIVKTIITEVE